MLLNSKGSAGLKLNAPGKIVGSSRNPEWGVRMVSCYGWEEKKLRGTAKGNCRDQGSWEGGFLCRCPDGDGVEWTVDEEG